MVAPSAAAAATVALQLLMMMMMREPILCRKGKSFSREVWIWLHCHYTTSLAGDGLLWPEMRKVQTAAAAAPTALVGNYLIFISINQRNWWIVGVSKRCSMPLSATVMKLEKDYFRAMARMPTTTTTPFNQLSQSSRQLNSFPKTTGEPLVRLRVPCQREGKDFIINWIFSSCNEI